MDYNMGSLTAAALQFLLLLLTMKPQGRAKAHPMYGSASAAELADFKVRQQASLAEHNATKGWGSREGVHCFANHSIP